MSEFEPEDGLIGEPWGSAIRIMRSADAATQLDPGQECRSGEEGHVWVNTPALMRGYYHRPDLTDGVVAGGWFSTGDIGVVDQRGWLYLRGREREEINKGGMKIHPADVDAVAERFPQSVDVCTFAVEDALLGEDVGIALVLRHNDDATRSDLHLWMARHLASHQMPRRWWLLDEIPRTSRGKINRSEVAARCAAMPPVSIGTRGSASR
jgi:acyl-CoA synthetase (AMP-forming)/AMP-acid ligase II